MSDFGDYLARQTETKLASTERSLATVKLEFARVKERAAEIRSQHEPLNTLTAGDAEERQRILDAVFYVLVGRFPKK